VEARGDVAGREADDRVDVPGIVAASSAVALAPNKPRRCAAIAGSCSGADMIRCDCLLWMEMRSAADFGAGFRLGFVRHDDEADDAADSAIPCVADP
jgi:hypothetical protein